MRKILDFLIKLSVYGLVFLMPLFWLPITNEVFEFNKQALLIALTSVALMSWLARMIVVQKKLVFRRTPLDIFVLVFMVVMSVSAVFSIDPISSWLGAYGQFSDSVAGFLAMGLLYFIITNNTASDKASVKENLDSEKKREKNLVLSVSKMVNWFLTSSWLVVIIAYFSVFGIWSKIPDLPIIMKISSFNTIALSFESFAFFLVVIISLLTGIILNYPSDSRKKEDIETAKESKIKKLKDKSKDLGELVKVSHYLLLVLAVILMVMINSWAAWMALGLVMLFLLVFAFSTRLFKDKVNLLITPIVLAVFAVLSLTGVLGQAKQYGPSFLTPNTPREINLTYSATSKVSWQAFLDHPVIGSGPGTFEANFKQYKPEQINKTQFWNSSFDKASSQFLEMFATTGALGIVSYLAIIFVFLLVSFLAFRRFKKEGANRLSDSQIGVMLGLILGWMALFLSQVLYVGNTTILSFFWIFTALTLVGWQRSKLVPVKKHSFTFKEVPEIGLVMNVVMLILLFGFVALVYMGGRFYAADVVYADVLSSIQRGKNVLKVEDGIKKLEKAVNLHPYRWNYRRTLAQAYLAGAQSEANKSQKDRNVKILQRYATGAVQQARVATQISPNLVGTWYNLGLIYRDARLIINGALPFTEKAFKKAAELAPRDPSVYQELCRVNLLQDKKKLDDALKYCQKAVDLKENYLDAYFQLALAYEKKGDLEAAINELQSLLQTLKGKSIRKGSAEANAVSEIYFQLGRFHFSLKNFEDAVKMFEQSVMTRPSYANGHYALALSYESIGKIKYALTQYQITDKLIGGSNEALKQKINSLRAVIQQQEQAKQQEENNENSENNQGDNQENNQEETEEQNGQ